MSQESDPQELQPPGPPPKRRGRDLLHGLGVTPEDRMKILSADHLESLVTYWLFETVVPHATRVRKYGGAGDKGRDVVAEHGTGDGSSWDNYQCKRYGAALMPSDVWGEIGKVVHYSGIGDYSAPAKYYFVAPKGCGPTLLDLLKSPEKLKAGLKEHWEAHCGLLAPLDSELGAIESFDFSIFGEISPHQIVTDLKGTAAYSIFFGGGLAKPRPEPEIPPDVVDDSELNYVSALVAAYNDDSADPIDTSAAAFEAPIYRDHLRRSRRTFYCAESLREFSKDVLVEEESFRGLQDEIFDGVIDIVGQTHSSGYQRALHTASHAVTVELSDHALVGVIEPRDRVGMCHQLANDLRIKWLP